MLPKRQRITKSLFPKGNSDTFSVSNNILTLVFSKKKHDRARWSFVISKKSAGKATERNLLRRRGYSIIEQNPIFMTKKRFFIVYLKKEAITESFLELQKNLTEVFKKIR